MILLYKGAASNLASVCNALDYLSLEYRVTDLADSRGITGDDILVIPGVGSFEASVSHASFSHLKKALSQGSFFRVVGICLGMQLCFDSSEEAEKGNIDGIGLISAPVRRLKDNENIFCNTSVGWHKTSMNIEGFPEHDYFYYVHSYGVRCDDLDQKVLTRAGLSKSSILRYNINDTQICAGIWSDSLRIFQFHPEKSGKSGLQLLSRALEQ